jgi:transposase-like protein
MRAYSEIGQQAPGRGAGDEPPLTLSERARLRELEREVRELRMITEFLGKAAAFFAQEYR